MPKKQVEINKTNQARISRWMKTDIYPITKDIEKFESSFSELVLNEVKSHKECTEKSVVEAYIDAFNNAIRKVGIADWDKLNIVHCIAVARKALAAKYTSGHNLSNNIDIYFNDVKREYILHPMNESDSLEFLPENRDIFIKNNLKLVINCAKRYRGLGLTFEDLIQTGNYGLLVAFEKFDTERANLRSSINNNIEKSKKKSFTYDDAKNLVSASFTYDKDLDRTLKTLPQEGFANKQLFYDWAKANVKTAVFASVAFQWIRAYILYELYNTAGTVKVPKSNKAKPTEDEVIAGIGEEKAGPAVVSLDSVNPHTNDNYHDNQMASVATERFVVEDSRIDNQDNEELFHDIITKAVSTLSDINRRIIKKRFGIGFPAALNVNEIADSEGIAPNRVKYIISTCLQELGRTIPKRDKMVLMEIFGSVVEDD